jgi:hypothetical protein
MRVNVHGVGFGNIINVRDDSTGRALYTVRMDNPRAEFFVARGCELTRPDGNRLPDAFADAPKIRLNG